MGQPKDLKMKVTPAPPRSNLVIIPPKQCEVMKRMAFWLFWPFTYLYYPPRIRTVFACMFVTTMCIQCVSLDSTSLIIYPEIKATEVPFKG